MEEVRQAPHNIPRILIGTKSDLKDEKISEKAQTVKEQFGFLHYQECSSLALENLNEVFWKATDAAFKRQAIDPYR